MISKEVLAIFLLSGTLQILASDNTDKSLELQSSHEFHKKQLKHAQKDHGENYDPTLQFQMVNHKWGEKTHTKPKPNKYLEHKDHLKFNEIDSNEYVDKYNKYGNTFDPELVKVQKYKMYQKQRAAEKEKEGSLLHDLNVNYVKNNKEVSSDSELITERREPKSKEGSITHDLNVNSFKNNKEVSADAELITERREPKSKERFMENYQNGNEMYMKRFKKDFYQSLSKIDLSSPPPANDTILMARYIVHTVDWAALGTLSARASTKGAPFVCVKATSDGMKNESSGIPFFYMSPMDLCTQDLQKDNRVSVLVTLSETEYCKNQNLDPQDPRCAKLTLSGKIKKIKPGSDEEKFAKSALFSRHPAMKTWPAGHNWYFTKLKIGQIILLDHFGGATYIKVKDYLNGKPVDPELRRK